MSIDQIAVRFTNRPHPTPIEISISPPYRQRWWLPIIGPTATCLLTHLDRHTNNDNWGLLPAQDLATALGLGNGTSKRSPLIRSLHRLTQFGFGHFEIEPDDHSDPCITLYRTTSPPPAHLTRQWPADMKHAHDLELANLLEHAC